MTVPEMAWESLRPVWNYDDTVLGSMDIWNSSGSWFHTPFLRNCHPPSAFSLSSFHLLFSSPSREGNSSREGRPSPCPHPSPQKQATLLCHSCHCVQGFPEKGEKEKLKEENLKPLHFPVKFWIVVSLSSFDSAFICFWPAPLFTINIFP